MTPVKGAEPGWTKGEWRVTTDQPGVMYRGLVCILGTTPDGKSYDVVVDDDYEIHVNEILANATLAAAAPNLYEALEWTLGALQDALKGAPFDAAPVFSLAESALSKARGENP